MENKKNEEIGTISDNFLHDYELIMKDSKRIPTPIQWLNPGDNFEKLTMYVDDTPTYSSGSTCIIPL